MSDEEYKTPAGWYDDPNNPGQQAYWDGKEWAPAPIPGAASDRPPRNTLGIIAVVVAVIALLAALAGPFGIPFAIAGLVLAILAAIRGRGPLAWVALFLSVVGLLVSVFVTINVWIPAIT